MKQRIPTHSLGYPRIGAQRELKKATESYWQGASSLEALEQVGRDLRRANWLAQQEAGLDLIPSNDFSFYDQMLDMSCLLGNVPARFHWDGSPIGLDLRFRIARGAGGQSESCDCARPHTPLLAAEMTKWFDTNYHYLVPEFTGQTTFRLGATKPFDELAEALALGIRSKPVLIGPVTYLILGKVTDGTNLDRLDLLEKILPVYVEILRRLREQGAEWVQLDEPVLALDLTAGQREALLRTYEALGRAVPDLKILLASYFGGLGDNLALACGLPVAALHVDAVRGREEFSALLREFPGDRILSLGVIDGRNIWKTDLYAWLDLVDQARQVLGTERLWLAPSCSLIHVPVTLGQEPGLDPELKTWLAFAREKLDELSVLARHAAGDYQPFAMRDNQGHHLARQASPRIHQPAVKARAAAVTASDASRRSPYALRRSRQRARLDLPLFPTTTIGSFPQTPEVRSARSRWKQGKLDSAAYETFLEEETARCVRRQEDLGLDVLVHGEFERNDMVEYFGEQLNGFAFTANGWVQSYGSRCVKPPVIFGDVSRTGPMTVRWSAFAQSLTDRPMKGMLTGPVTVLQWSFVRDDQPRSETAKQIALALRDEVIDLEAAGIAVIQIDEPALREGLPLRRADWPAYLDWAVRAFQLAAAGVRDDTQIHTHMCYCEFNDIIQSIAALDADVISIETSRSKMELLDAFVGFRYPLEVGPGVWDIHSPRVPSTEEMVELLQKAARVLPVENLWVNPDCGLKTRDWEETTAALKNLVEAARKMRDAKSE